VEEVSVLGDEEEDEPVAEAEKLPVEVVAGQGARAQGLAQPAVGRVGEKAAAEAGDGLLHARAQAVQGARAPASRLLRPALEPALLRPLRLQAGLVAEEPEEDEVGVDLALHHRLQVELDVGLAGEGGVVAE